MYQTSFYLKKVCGNNAIGFNKRKNKQLFVPSLIGISDWSQIELGTEIVFGDIDFDGVLQEKSGLKNLALP